MEGALPATRSLSAGLIMIAAPFAIWNGWQQGLQCHHRVSLTNSLPQLHDTLPQSAGAVSAAQNKHIVWFAYQAWGSFFVLVVVSPVTGQLTSVRRSHPPSCWPGAHMVKLRPVDGTLITTSAFYDRTKNELARHFKVGEEDYS